MCIRCLQGIQYPIPSKHVEAVTCFFVGSAMRFSTDQGLSIYDHFNSLRNVASRMLQPHVVPSVDPGRCELTKHSGRGFGPRDVQVNLQVCYIENTSIPGLGFEEICTGCVQYKMTVCYYLYYCCNCHSFMSRYRPSSGSCLELRAHPKINAPVRAVRGLEITKPVCRDSQLGWYGFVFQR